MLGQKKKGKDTYVLVDGENIIFSIQNKYGLRLNFHRVVQMLTELYGDVKVFVFGHFSDDGNGLFLAVKQHIQSCPHTHVVDTRVSNKPHREQSDLAMLEELTMGINGLFQNLDAYERAVFMTGDGSMLRAALHCRDVFDLDTIVMAEEGTINASFMDAGINVVHVDPIVNNLLVVNKLDDDIFAAAGAGSVDDMLEAVQVNHLMHTPAQANERERDRIRSINQVRRELIRHRINLMLQAKGQKE
jgi:hypothetical protein